MLLTLNWQVTLIDPPGSAGEFPESPARSLLIM